MNVGPITTSLARFAAEKNPPKPPKTDRLTRVSTVIGSLFDSAPGATNNIAETLAKQEPDASGKKSLSNLPRGFWS